MPPFPLPTTGAEHPHPAPPSPSSSSSTTAAPATFTSLLKGFVRGAKAHSTTSSSGAVPAISVTGNAARAGSLREGGPRGSRPSMVGSSSRSAGVRPSRSATIGSSPTVPRREESVVEALDPLMSTGVTREDADGKALPGPSRGGFIVSPHPTSRHSSGTIDMLHSNATASTSKLSTASSSSRPSSLRRKSVEVLVPVVPAEPEGAPVLPPSKILPRLSNLAQESPDVVKLVPLIRLLSQSVSLYPFPPPSLAATSLSEALAKHGTTTNGLHTPQSVEGLSALPAPSPLQIYVSQSHLLSSASPPAVRAALLELMKACVDASIGSMGGMKEGEKAVYWDEARRWSDEAKVEVDDGQGGKRWVLLDSEREALVAILSSLTKGGRDLSDVPGLVALLCTYVTDSLPVPLPTSPLFDPTLSTSFKRTTPPTPAPHTSSLALLTSLHKFSAPHIYTASTLLALRAALEVAKLQEERDIGGQNDVGVLPFLGAVVRFGEVTGGKAARRKTDLMEGSRERGPLGENEGDEILREVVSIVARIIGCEGLVGVVEVQAGKPLAKVHDERTKPSVLPPLALELMRDLLRSPANQALKSLRNTLVAPPPTSPPPPTPVLLLVGALRSLRKALIEHSADAEASINRGESTSLTTGESRWPSMLSLGLPFLWRGLCRVMLWKSGHVDGEVLRLIEERLEAGARVGARAKEAAAAAALAGSTEAGGVRAKEFDEGEGGVSYEDWDMAIEALDRTKWHIGAWEELKRRPWVMDDDDTAEEQESDSEDEQPQHFTQRPSILTAFSLLLRTIVRAWRTPGFSGPSERLFTILISLAPHLSDTYAFAVLEQCELNGLCLPSHPEWLARIQEVVKAFYVVPTGSSRLSRRGSSPATRRRTIQLLASLHGHLRLFPTARETLVGTVIMQLLEATCETETDVNVAAELIKLLAEVGRDALVDDEDAAETSGAFDRLRLLLVRVAKGSVKPGDRFSSSVPTTPKQKPGAALSSLSRYHKDSSPSTMRSSPSISAPMSSSQQLPPSNDSRDVSVLAVLALTTLFHSCLFHSTRQASEKAIIIFRDLLNLLVPNLFPKADSPDTVVPVQTRFAVLQWFVRLRADAAHRINWVKDVDISGPAAILRRQADVASEAVTEALSAAVGRPAEEGPSEARGRTARGQASDRTGRNLSGSRLRLGSEERSPSRGGASRSRAPVGPVSSTPTLWTVPESLPFDFGTEIASIGGDGLASFDHNRMRDWTEEEDPGTGLMKVKEAEDLSAPEDLMVVLPVSEYLKAINHLLQHEPEWELVSYVLCHLPEQLSNKHFACGPRAAQQLHGLRQLLCGGLRGGERVFLADVVLPPGLKRAEVHAVAYQCLSTLIAYRSLFNKQHQDDLVDTFMYGLGNPRDTAKPCIHALAMAAFELRPSMTKHLAEIVRHLQKIISSATLGVHILELIAGVGQQPSLYANFTEIDFQTVFGIALKYIQAHNERPPDSEAEEGIEYAFSQYVFLLAYYVIAAWYMALRLTERPKYVPFLTRRLIQANEGKPEIDEPTEVCFDMIARYAYSNADPRPRLSAFDKMITTGRTATPSSSKTWIVGHATVTVKSTPAPAWVEVTIRRASGVVKMLWELQNISGVQATSDVDSIAMYLRHRETAQVSLELPSIISEALSSLPSPPPQPHLGHRARSQSFSGTTSSLRSPEATIEANTVLEAINSAATISAQPTLESGVLAVDPSFFTLQLSSFPEFGPSGPPLLVPSDPGSQRGITALDRLPVVDFHKIGVLYAGQGQRTEREILSNTHGSKAYIEFISSLGQLVRLKGSRELDIYAGGLDQENDIDGRWTYLWDDDIAQIVFHVATLMPTSPETDPQATLKKRHIGNDFVKVVFNDSGAEFAFDTLPGDFNFVNIVIQPHTPAGNPWSGPGMTNNAEFFKVSMQCRPGMPEVGPLGAFKMVTGSSLPAFVRQLSLHSNIFAQIYLASVGFEARQGTQKLEYSSNWRKRLQQIKLLKSRILHAQGIAPTDPSATPLDLDAAEASRMFTSWL